MYASLNFVGSLGAFLFFRKRNNARKGANGYEKIIYTYMEEYYEYHSEKR